MEARLIMKILRITTPDGTVVAVEFGKVLRRVVKTTDEGFVRETMDSLKKSIQFDSAVDMMKSFPIIQRRMLPNGDVVFS